LNNAASIAVTAGASTPELLVERVIKHLQSVGFADVTTLPVVDENVHFALPPELDKVAR
jgi:4-hydroxy-3-methylbut-2-enyl diphosphate reductase